MPRLFVCVLVAVWVSAIGCRHGADPYESGPSTQNLREQFAVAIPAYLRLTSFDVQASAPIGDKVEPAFKARFTASVSLEADTYFETRREGATVYAKPHLKAGEARNLYGIAISNVKAGSWQTTFTLDGDPLAAIGKPRDLFDARRVLVCQPSLIPGDPEECVNLDH